MPHRSFKKADFLLRLFDSIPSLLFIVDSDVRIFHLNSAAEKALGAVRDAVLMKRGGEALRCILSTDSPEGCGRSAYCSDCVIRNSVGRAFVGESVYRETTRMELRTDEKIEEIHMLVTANPFDYEGKKFVLLALEDVTKEKRYEEALSQRAAELEAANRELEAFSYSVSHDLKTPLRGIGGFGEALLEDYSDRLDDRGKDYLTRICAASRRMSQLIDDMLNFSKTTRAEMNRIIVDLGSLAASVAADLLKSRPERRVEFVIAPDLTVNADPRMLRVALENLLGNAFKFTSGRPGARIEVGRTAKEGRAAYFVKDNGPGFDMTYAGKLFVPFQRLHDASQFPGTGIGLATVRRIIHRHGGEIWAEGAVGKGATFYFTLS